MKIWKCSVGDSRHFNHAWDEWQAQRSQITQNHVTLSGQPKQILTGYFIEQHRRCKRCGFVESTSEKVEL